MVDNACHNIETRTLVTCSSSNVAYIPDINIVQVSIKKNAIDLCNTTGANSGARSTYTSGTIVFTPRFSEVVLLSI